MKRRSTRKRNPIKRFFKSSPLSLPSLNFSLSRKFRRLKRSWKHSQFRLPSLNIRFRKKSRRRKRGLSFPTFKLPSFNLLSPFQQVSYSRQEETNSLFLLSWLGYVILLGSVIDYLLILYPPQLTDPNWEFQAFTQMVNNAWALLLAVLLIFLPKRDFVRRLELNFLSLIRWGLLLGGILFILLVPLGIMNTIRIQQNTVAQFSRQETARSEQLNNLQQALESEQLSQQQLQRLAVALNLQEVSNSSQLDTTLIEEIEDRKKELRQQVTTEKSNRSRQLVGQAIRVNLQALLIGSFLIRSWWEIRWLKQIRKRASRKRYSQKKEQSSQNEMEISPQPNPLNEAQENPENRES